MVGAGALIQPLLGLRHEWGVIIVGVAVIIIVVTAGMVSTTWVQFIKGSLLVFFCTILVIMILGRGLHTSPPANHRSSRKSPGKIRSTANQSTRKTTSPPSVTSS